MRYHISSDYGWWNERDYVAVVIGEERDGTLLIIGEGRHFSNVEIAKEIAIRSIKSWWKRWLIRWREEHKNASS